jgi:hypothetical protein
MMMVFWNERNPGVSSAYVASISVLLLDGFDGNL